MIAVNFNLLGMDQRCFRRSQQKVREKICSGGAGNGNRCPKSNAEIGLPGFPAELAPLDLDRLLPAKILRLFVRQDFLWVGVRADGPQFCQTITSFSSSTP